MKKTVVTRKLASGSVLTVQLGDYCGRPVLQCRLDGIWDKDTHDADDGLVAIAPVTRDGATYTHRLGRYALTAADAAAIGAAVAEAATTPEAESRRNRATRDGLARALGAALDVKAAAERRAIEAGHACTESAELGQRVAAAREALRAFDAAHPEVVAEIERERTDAVQRAAWM